MKVAFIGASRRVGTSKKTGNKYDICRVSYAIAGTSKTTSDYQYEIHGGEMREIDLDPQALGEFAGIPAGAKVDLVLESDPNNPSRNRVVGVKSDPKLNISAA